MVCKQEFQQTRKQLTCSKKCRYTSTSKAKKDEKFLSTLWAEVGKENIKNKVNNFHSPLMIYDFLNRDFSHILKMFNINKRKFRNIINKQFIFDISGYNRQQNHFKLQYKFPKETSLEQLKIIQKEYAQKGQKETIKIRNKKHAFNKKQSLEYWLSVFKDENEAKKALDKHKKESSPFCIEFYLRRGYSEVVGRKEMLKLNCMGALAALKKCQKPRTENTIKEILEKNNIEYVAQYKVKLKKEEKEFRKSFYVYDFYLPKLNVLIDCHGTYWHCDPRIYKSGDNIKFAGKDEISVNFVWDIDAHRKKIALIRKYRYVVFWELDLKEGCDEKVISILRN